MSTDAPRRAEVLFYEALELPLGEREAFLNSACGADVGLHVEVDELLRAHDGGAAFLHVDAPASAELEAEFASLKSEEVGDRIGPYKLLQQLGEGGFGTVWMAEQAEPVKRRVALKIIKIGMDTKEVLARFEQERQALAMMDHPNIAKVFDAGGTQWGRPFFVMELVRGVPITAYCDDQKLSVPERLALFIEVGHALQHAHQKGIIHRDLKPSNILVTAGDDHAPVPKLIDFGVAKAMDRTLTDKTLFTQFEQMIGTPAYMSPEQAGAGPMDIDTRSDIYTLGVVLYEMLTGNPPFDPDHLNRAGREEIRRVIREQEPPKPSARLSTLQEVDLSGIAARRHVEPAKLAAIVRGDLDWIVMKALEKNRSRRYETVNGLVRDIQHHLDNEPVLARPPSFSYKAGKFIRKYKGSVIAASAVLATLIAGLTTSTALYLREKVAWASEATQRAAAERHAQAEAAARQEAEAISTLITEVFQSPDPERDGRTITVAETLDRAVKKLDSDLASQPARRIKLHQTLGSTYHALGLDRDGIPLLENARDYYVTTLDPEHPNTLLATSDVAVLYHRAGRRDEALNMQEVALPLTRKVLGSEHPRTLRAMSNLAGFYLIAGRQEDALKLQEELLPLSRKINGQEHPDTLRATRILASLYSNAGRRDEALKLREELLPLGRKINGQEHPDTLRATLNLALSYFTSGQQEEALKLQGVLRLYLKVNGPEHPDTLSAIGNLASLYSNAGRGDEALELRKELLPLSRRVKGPEHPDTLLAIHNLASSYHDTARRDEALKLREEVLVLRRKVLGPEHPDTLSAMQNLAMSYAVTARRGEALKLQEEALVLCRKVNGPEHPATLSAMHNLAISYAETARREEALKLQEEALVLCRKVNGPELARTIGQEVSGIKLKAGRQESRRTVRSTQVVARRVRRNQTSQDNSKRICSSDIYSFFTLPPQLKIFAFVPAASASGI